MKKLIGAVALLGLGAYAILDSLKEVKEQFKEPNLEDEINEMEAELTKLRKLKELDLNADVLAVNFDVDKRIKELEDAIAFAQRLDSDEYEDPIEMLKEAREEQLEKEKGNMQSEVEDMMNQLFPGAKVKFVFPNPEEIAAFNKKKMERAQDREKMSKEKKRR